jgi:hypothetical protein
VIVRLFYEDSEVSIPESSDSDRKTSSLNLNEKVIKRLHELKVRRMNEVRRQYCGGEK